MLIKKVNKTQIDVFFNEGWDNWGRFSIDNNKVSQLCGVKFPPNILMYLKKKYETV